MLLANLWYSHSSGLQFGCPRLSARIPAFAGMVV
jgi:hypothetical protein